MTRTPLFRSERNIFQVSISPTFYARLFHMKVLLKAFFTLLVWTFLGRKNIDANSLIKCWWNWPQVISFRLFREFFSSHDNFPDALLLRRISWHITAAFIIKNADWPSVFNRKLKWFKTNTHIQSNRWTFLRLTRPGLFVPIPML